MGLLDRIFGTPAPKHGAPGRPPPGSDTYALERYRYMLQTAPPETIEQAHAEAFEQLTPEQRREVLAELAEADPDRCAFGVDRVWAAARTGRVTVLCVEDGFTYPARPVRDGRGLEVADPLDGRDVLDDAVDEIIELVRLDGGRVVTVRDGALAGCGSIGALLRTH
jgi:hypothetical protein